MIFKIAIENLKKNRKRTISTGLAVTISVFVMIVMGEWMMGMKKSMIDGITSLYGHVLIQNKEKDKAPNPYSLKYRIEGLNSLVKEIKKHPGVEGVSPRIEFGALVYSDTTSVFMAGIGINPRVQKQFKSIKNSIQEGAFLVKNGVVISKSMAKLLGLKLGNILSIYFTKDGFPRVVDEKIVGVFETGNKDIDENLFFIRFSEAQKILQMENTATSVSIFLKDYKHPDKFLNGMKEYLSRNNLIGKTWIEMAGALIKFVNIFLLFILGMDAFIILIAAICIINTVFIGVSERTRTIGTMRAIGMKRKNVVGMIIYEYAILGFFGALVGLISGALFSWFLATKGIYIGEIMYMVPGASAYLKSDFNVFVMLMDAVLGVLITVLASIWPAYYAAYKKPGEALRYV